MAIDQQYNMLKQTSNPFLNHIWILIFKSITKSIDEICVQLKLKKKRLPDDTCINILMVAHLIKHNSFGRYQVTPHCFIHGEYTITNRPSKMMSRNIFELASIFVPLDDLKSQLKQIAY